MVASRGSEAVNTRGIRLAWSGDAAGAEAAFREADGAGSSAASFNLAQLLAKEGDERGAIAAFQRAVRRGHVVAGFSLGGLLAESGDMHGSIEAYGFAAERGHPLAAYELGRLYVDRGDLESARSAFEKADELGHAWAALELGEILEHTGDRDGAIAAYWRAADRRVATARARLEALMAGSGAADAPTAALQRGEQVAPPAGPGEPPPPGAHTAPGGWTRRRLAWTVGIVAALLTFTLLALLPPASPKAPHPGITPPVTRARTGGTPGDAHAGGSAPASQSHATSFTAAQTALVANVPAAAHVQCLSAAGQPLPRAAAGIRCVSASTGVSVLYYGFTSRTQLGRVFHNYRAWFASRHKLRDCAGLTHGVYYQGTGSTIAGRWACFHNDRAVQGRACIDWADYALLVFGSACRADGDFTALKAWWTHAGPAPASIRDFTNRD